MALRAFALAGLMATAAAGALPDAFRLREDACACDDAELCKPLDGPPVSDREIFGFGADNWQDWPDDVMERITTIAWGGTDVVCRAHSLGARVVAAAPAGMPLTANSTERQAWIDTTVSLVVSGGYDGVVFDYESPLAPHDPRNVYYVEIISETRSALHAIHDGYQVSVCIPWSPGLPLGIDGRAYDFRALVAAADVGYQMLYDTQSQIFGRCEASANSPLTLVNKGIQDYAGLDIPASKLILGTPFYGYSYPCQSMAAQDTVCFLYPYDFRGVDCSDGAGTEIPYSSIMDVVLGRSSSSKMITDVMYEDYLVSFYFNYAMNGDDTVYQMWYDTANSSAAKYAAAAAAGYRGWGPYRFDQLDWVSQPELSRAMFEALMQD